MKAESGVEAREKMGIGTIVSELGVPVALLFQAETYGSSACADPPCQVAPA